MAGAGRLMEKMMKGERDSTYMFECKHHIISRKNSCKKYIHVCITSPEEIKQTVRKDYWRQKEDKRREKSERVLKDLETRKEKIKKDIEETKDRVKEDWERLLKQMSIDGYKDGEDDNDYGNQSSPTEVTQNTLAKETNANQATAKKSDTGELAMDHLPRGWSDLRRLYTYNFEE